MPRNPASNPTADSDRTWYSLVAQTDDAPAEILIYDYIGSFGVTAADFDRDLKILGRPTKATMRINSPGGEVPTAASIYNMLERWVAKNDVELTVIIDGIAASSASWIAMLGETIIMPENTLMMIHDPAGYVVGTSRDMKTMAAVLERIKQGMVSAYVKKSGQSAVEVEAIMTAETWFSAQEAVDAGFADVVDNPTDIVATFDLSRFKNPPDVPVAARTRSGASEETSMVTKPNETPVEMEARLRAEITASLTPAPKSEPVVAAAVAAETPAQMEERIRAGITAANAEVNTLCIIAGKPEMAATFVAQGKTPAEVRVALEAAVKAAPAATEAARVNTHGGADPDAGKDLVATGIDALNVWANYNKGGKGTPVNYAKH